MNEAAKVTLEIENFCNVLDLKQKDIILPSNNKIKFVLYCNPQYTGTAINYKYTSTYLYLASCDKNSIPVRHQISILNENGDKCCTQERVETFTNGGNGGQFLISFDYLSKPENGFLVNGKISIYCEIEEIDPKTPFSFKNQEKQELPANPISENVQFFLESDKFSDASLIVAIGEKRLLVHKAILSARSKVFAAMFENDCEEKRKNRVEITDISVEVCEQMLSYIYTGKTPDMNKYAADLFVVADKYELVHLKAVCEQYFSTKIDVDNAANTLLVADMHHATVLKKKSLDFIVNNATKVMATEGWKTLSNRAELVTDLFQKLAIKTSQ